MRNDHALEINGIGFIRLRIFDGTIYIVQGLRYLKGLKKNILFLGQLGDLGYKTYIKEEILKIIKGMLIVMKIEKLVPDLYLVLWETLQEVYTFINYIYNQPRIINHYMAS